MTCSPARLAANQRNAQRSTGPKTPEGKAASRLNALRHGMAGAGDLIGPGVDPAVVERRTAAFAREFAASGEAGAILARRAAVLSVRMERLADRDEVTVTAARAEARAAFDADRLAELDVWLAQLEEEGTDPAPALGALEHSPAGVDLLRAAWLDLRDQVQTADPVEAASALARARLWLTPSSADDADLVALITAEVARLNRVAGSMTDQVRQVEAARREAELRASFDPGPEATLARRYEAAAERGMYRALRDLATIRRDREAMTPTPPLGSAPVGPRPGSPPASAPVTPPGPDLRPEPVAPDRPDPGAVGSFRVGNRNPFTLIDDGLLGPVRPTPVPVDPPKKRPDLRKVSQKRH